jgi:uncharacterized coiled-coil DUF342 family protein
MDFNNMLIREKFLELVQKTDLVKEGQDEIKERLIAQSKQIDVLKEMIKNIKKTK